jgi:predicted hydrocarbon binding protein
MEIQEIRLFSSDKSVHAIKSPVKIEIFNLLDQGDCSFDAIVAATGKAKSTISAHIKDLEERGLLFSHPDPADLRKRIISKSAICIGTLRNQDRNLQNRLVIPKDITHLQTLDLFRIILTTLKTEALSLGINVDPLFKRVGSQIGTHLAPWFVQNTLEDMLKIISQFWHDHGLGTLKVKGMDPIIIEITDCIECSQYPITKKIECHFSKGFLKTLFSQYFQTEAMVTEKSCYAAGDSKCMFEIVASTRQKKSEIEV